jgi:hypothetical protein
MLIGFVGLIAVEEFFIIAKWMLDGRWAFEKIRRSSISSDDVPDRFLGSAGGRLLNCPFFTEN